MADALDAARSELWSDRRLGASRGWRRIVFPAVFLAFLGQTAHGVHVHSSGPAVVAGYAVLVAFCAIYLVVLGFNVHRSSGSSRYLWAACAVMITLTIAETFFAHSAAFIMLVYVAVLVIADLGARSVPIIVAFVAVTAVVPALVPSWHQGVDLSSAFSIAVVSLAMYGFFSVLHVNRELSEARTEVARLAAENERSRIARDLHDLLGHSLTTINVKAQLARRLASRDPERAAVEIGEVERLSRAALTDVRAAVANYRDVTLAGELATGRELLRAGGIDAQFPTATDVVDDAYAELFGWVVREALTNVVRHARATRCAIVLGRQSIEIVDDGMGGFGTTPGSGLAGVKERVEAAGGTLAAGRMPRGGWRVRVDMPEPPVASRPPGERDAEPAAPVSEPAEAGEPEAQPGPALRR